MAKVSQNLQQAKVHRTPKDNHKLQRLLPTVQKVSLPIISLLRLFQSHIDDKVHV